MEQLLHRRYQVARDRMLGLWCRHRLQALLWALLVIGVAAYQWHTDRLTHHSLNLLALIIHCATAGLIGLVVLTWAELRLEPGRFDDC